MSTLRERGSLKCRDKPASKTNRAHGGAGGGGTLNIGTKLDSSKKTNKQKNNQQILKSRKESMTICDIVKIQNSREVRQQTSQVNKQVYQIKD